MKFKNWNTGIPKFDNVPFTGIIEFCDGIHNCKLWFLDGNGHPEEHWKIEVEKLRKNGTSLT
jgi:hypothetical protein